MSVFEEDRARYCDSMTNLDTPHSPAMECDEWQAKYDRRVLIRALDEARDEARRGGTNVRQNVEAMRAATAAYMADDPVATFVYDHRDHDTFTGFGVAGPYVGCNNCCRLVRWATGEEPA